MLLNVSITGTIVCLETVTLQFPKTPLAFIGLRSTWPVPMAIQRWSLSSWRENACLTSVTVKTGPR